MVRLASLALLVPALILMGCTPRSEPAAQPLPSTAKSTELFEVPYFPRRDMQMLGRPVTDWSPLWTAACVYSDEVLTDEQRLRVSQLEPAGGEGLVGLSFERDWDGDGRLETVRYGAFAKSGEEGNFVLVTRHEASEQKVLLLKELPGPPRFSVFTLKPDGSLWFGGGIDAGEVTMTIRWVSGQAVFQHLMAD